MSCQKPTQQQTEKEGEKENKQEVFSSADVPIPGLREWPLSTLVLSDIPLVELEGGPSLEEEWKKEHGIRSLQMFILSKMERPLWLCVFHFDSSSPPQSREKKLMDWAKKVGLREVHIVENGPYTLVAGIVGTKPIDTSLREILLRFVSAFAGEE